MKETQMDFHKNRIRHILDGVAYRVLLRIGRARLVTVAEIVDELTLTEMNRLVRSAYLLATIAKAGG
jgi:hypothetical protein